MGRFTQFDALVIKDFEEEVFHLPAHGHTYYELIYIYKGTGFHLINNSAVPYKEGSLFMISPEDEHQFEITKSTRFIIMKFTDVYFDTKGHHPYSKNFEVIPEEIMRLKLLKEVKLEFGKPYRTLLHQTIKNIILYNGFKNAGFSPFIQQQLLSIFGLIKEVMMTADHSDHQVPNREAIISFIHQNIYYPKSYSIKNIAGHFNIANSYFSDYFKRNFGISYRDYINQYRVKLIENRINAGQMSLKQIAAEFGFTDESHLSNYFKTHHLLRPRDYRKKLQL